ncbi:hypothetical protein AB6A40_004421 [Gnathostoma spinigerum]|uniref:Uncharacterized protein n=1 Tax=Gnathostoma spinigerum TaxID=75299 RepID=A0ABD6EEL4_9BILA
MLIFTILLLISTVHSIVEEFELDTSLPTVTCRQCIQLWRSVSRDPKTTCGPQTRTCTGNACFMRQCKHCPMYQYMSGCLTLTEWQTTDLAAARQRGELLATRVGATLLCEDSLNQTTCICNRRNKCNDIHIRSPFTTYAGNLFGGIINIDAQIAKIDPRYADFQLGRYAFHFTNCVQRKFLSLLLLIPLLKSLRTLS